MKIIKRQTFEGSISIKGVSVVVEFVPFERSDNRDSDDNQGYITVSPPDIGYLTYSSALEFLGSLSDDDENAEESPVPSQPPQAEKEKPSKKEKASRQLSLPEATPPDTEEKPEGATDKKRSVGPDGAKPSKGSAEDLNAKYEACANVRAVVNQISKELGDDATWERVKRVLVKLHAAGVAALQREDYLTLAKAKAAGAGIKGAEDEDETE